MGFATLIAIPPVTIAEIIFAQIGVFSSYPTKAFKRGLKRVILIPPKNTYLIIPAYQPGNIPLIPYVLYTNFKQLKIPLKFLDFPLINNVLPVSNGMVNISATWVPGKDIIKNYSNKLIETAFFEPFVFVCECVFVFVPILLIY